MGDSPFGGGRHNRSRARPQVAVINPRTDIFGCRHYIGGTVRQVIDGRHQQFVPLGQGRACDLFVARPDYHAVDAFDAGASGLAETGRHVRQIQQLNHHVFQNVAGPGAFI